MLPDKNIGRPLPSLTIFKLEIIFRDDAAHNCLDGIHGKEPPRTRLAPESEVHACRADSNEAGRGGGRAGGGELIQHTQFFLTWIRHEGISVLWILAPAEPVEDIRIGEVGCVLAHWSSSEADVRSSGEDEAV